MSDTIGRALFEILKTGDMVLATQIISPHNINREARVSPPACSLPGPAGALASSMWMRSAFSDLEFPITQVITCDDQQWVHLRMQGTHTGPFVRYRDGQAQSVLPPTGRRLDFEQIHTLTITDGKISRHAAIRDDLTMLAQLGVLPPSPKTIGRIALWKMTGQAQRAATTVTNQAASAAAAVDES